MKTYFEFINESDTKNYKKYSLTFYFTDKNKNDKLEIKNLQNFLYDFFDKGYRYVGYDGFKSCNDSKHLGKNAAYAKIAKSKETGNIIAASVYTDRNDGYKCVGITATTDESERELGKKAVFEIIRSDIKEWNNWIWVEASGPAEYLYRKHGAFELPKEYVKDILFHKHIDINTDDEYHFITTEKDGSKCNRCIFGFNSEKTFNEVMKKHYDKINAFLDSRKTLDQDDSEDLDESKSNVKMTLKGAYAIVFYFVEEYEQNDAVFYPKETLERFYEALEFIKKQLKSKKVPNDKLRRVKNCIWNGEELKKKLKEIKLIRAKL